MKQVLLSLPWYDPELHKGVVEYSAGAGWHLVTDLQGFNPDNWTGDGIIARVSALPSKTLKRIAKTDISLVDVQSRPDKLNYPLIATNLKETVRLAFDYFRQQKGFQHFGFFGSTTSSRGKEFKALLEREGFECSVCNVFYQHLLQDREEVCRWVRSLPRQVAVFCDNDGSASALTSVILDLEITIPNEVAVLGTDNNELVCNSSSIPISSIDTNLFEVGYTAAEVLDARMNGDTSSPETYLISPKRILERASTDTLATKSADVRQAIEIMRRDHPNQLTINDLVADMAISQATLERAFRKELGITPAACLRDMRMREAARLLRTTSEKIEVISRMVGIPNAKHFATLFKRVWGLSPRDYRRRHREQT